ncbi:MAG TPA: aldehyde reductase [Caulobacteraceae bacterium]|nr:aldehyde reductase [Caulobacteraceae bacterium]
MAGETVLVTGGSGYIGGWCVAALLQRGYQVKTTVRSLKREAEVRDAIGTAAGSTDRLSFHAADLTGDAGWDEAAEGCAAVLHVASPLGLPPPKDENELIAPAREGALRALRAAKKAGARRVVMTSSVAAASRGREAGDATSDETVWTDPERPGLGAYAKSKTLAERAAWEFLERQGEGLELATIEPALVLGPVMSADYSGSVQVIERLMTGRIPGLPRLGFNVVDVRDVADLHLRAMTEEKAAGERFIAASDFLWMADMAAILKRRLGDKARKVPTRKVPDFVLKLFALFDPDVRTVQDDLGRRSDFSSAKARERLGWTPRPAEETIVDCAESLVAHGIA